LIFDILPIRWTAYAYRELADILDPGKAPFFLYFSCASLKRESLSLTEENLVLLASMYLGPLLVDGIGDGLFIDGGDLFAFKNVSLAFSLLQSSSRRITRAEFIACPSCGRTLFNLQTTTENIRQLTGHLKGVKIAIMGCVVNGPGEMADADFGYVGGAPGRINLYVAKDLVEHNVPERMAGEKLIQLIKKHGKWTEKKEAAKLSLTT